MHSVRLYKKEGESLRIYLGGCRESLHRLIFSLSSKFYQAPSNYDRREEDFINIIFEKEGEYYFPVGLLSIIKGELKRLSIEYKIEFSEEVLKDHQVLVSDDLLDGITLREYQMDCIHAALAEKRGILSCSTGSGKSEMIIAIASYLLENTEKNILICVPTTNLLYQMYDRMLSRGVNRDEISIYGDSNKLDTSRRIVISTIQSAYNSMKIEPFSSWRGELICLMLDEAHHGACRTWYTLIDTLSPEYILGFSAEPFYNDKDHIVRDLILRGSIGPVIHRISLDYLIERGFLSKPYVISMDSSVKGDIYRLLNWHTVNSRGIVKNELRNQLICDTAVSLVDINKNPLILVQQINHGTTLAKMISKEGKRVALMTGGLQTNVFLDGVVINKFKDADSQVKEDFQSGLYDVMIGTSVLDEGADIPALSSVILAGGSKSKLKLIQRIGRSLRKKEGTNTSYIIDFTDRFNVILSSHYKKRIAQYGLLGIQNYQCRHTDKLKELIDYIEDCRKMELGITENKL